MHGGQRLMQARVYGFKCCNHSLTSITEMENDDLKMLLDVRVLWGRRPSANSATSSPHNQQAELPPPLSQDISMRTQRMHRYIRIYDSQTEWQKVTQNRRHPNV